MNNMERKKLIPLSDYKDNIKGVNSFQKVLLTRLQPKLFQVTDFEELYFLAIQLIQPVNKGLEKDAESIERRIVKILAYFGFDKIKKVSIRKFGENGELEETAKEKKEKETPRDLFKKWILGLDDLPSVSLVILKATVGRDLNNINELVLEYEKDSEIEKYINNKNPKRDHETRTIIDFYNRTLRERQKVLNYYLKGVYERAIDKSRSKVWGGGLFAFGGIFKDYPYDFDKGFSFVNFDHQTIDKVSHRLDYIPIREIENPRELYGKDKNKFYRQLFKEYPVEDYLRIIDFHLNHVPTPKERKTIFSELKKLFLGERWLAFYALALPQVEGLFTEMMAAQKPDSKYYSRALSDKVDFLRMGSYPNDPYLDYYQYVLPLERNSFMHTGLTEDYQLKAFDLLTDLDHVLRLYNELDNPFVKLTRIMKKRNPDDFIDYKGFAVFFNLLRKIHSSQKKKEEQKIKVFLKEFLLTDCQLEVIAPEAIVACKQKTTAMFEVLGAYFKNRDMKKDIIELKGNKPSDFLRDISISNKMKDFLLYEQDDIRDLYLIKDFFIGLNKNFNPSLLEDTVKEALKLWEENKGFILNLEKIDLAIKKYSNKNR